MQICFLAEPVRIICCICSIAESLFLWHGSWNRGERWDEAGQFAIMDKMMARLGILSRLPPLAEFLTVLFSIEQHHGRSDRLGVEYYRP